MPLTEGEPSVAKDFMIKRILQSVERGFPYMPPAAILGVSFLKLTAFEHQFLMLILLIWTSAFFLFRAWNPQ